MAEESRARLLKEGDKFGDYTVVQLLGKGGMGAVYLACASDVPRYAVKVMDADAAQGKPDFHKRFMREGEFAVKRGSKAGRCRKLLYPAIHYGIIFTTCRKVQIERNRP